MYELDLDARVIQYDAAGNQARVDNRTFGYDGESRMKSAADAGTGKSGTYTYDGEGRRVKRVWNDGTTTRTTIYVYDALGRLAAESTTPATSDPAGTRYLTTDPLGSVRMVSDAAGNCLSRHDYLPFGEEIPGNWGVRGSCYGGADGVSTTGS